MKWITAFTLFLTFHFANGQVLTRQYIDERIVKFNPNTKGLPIIDYCINGEHYLVNDSLKKNQQLSKLDSVLGSMRRTDIAYIYGVRAQDIVSTTHNPNKVIAVIGRKGTQTTEEKEDLLKQALAKFKGSEIYSDHIDKSSKDPVLIINDKLIHFSLCQRELSKIQRKNIYAINVYDYPVPVEDYGENAKNGLIEIWKYPEKK